MGHDLLAGAAWSCCRTAPGEAGGPDELDGVPRQWMAASVPGTAAGALAADRGAVHDGDVDMDAWDWWFRCRLPAGGDGRWTLTLEGLATVADVWFGGVHVLHSENMFVTRSGRSRGRGRRRRPGRALRRSGPVARAAPAPAPVEVADGEPPGAAVVPDHRPRASAGMDRHPGPRRSLATGASRARRARAGGGAPGRGALWRRRRRGGVGDGAARRWGRGPRGGAGGGAPCRGRPERGRPGRGRGGPGRAGRRRRRGGGGGAGGAGGRAVVAAHPRRPTPVRGDRRCGRRDRRRRAGGLPDRGPRPDRRGLLAWW